MEQKQRNKIALILAVVLAPLLIYLVAVNVANVRKNPSPLAPVASVPGAEVVSPAVQPPATPELVAPKISAEQKKIAALLPKSNPFSPARAIIGDPAPVTAASAAPPPPTGIKLTAILSRPGGSGRAAMINGRLLGEGDHIAGWTIIKVADREVLLKNDARQMVLRLK